MKWQFLALATMDLMAYVDVDEMKHPTVAVIENSSSLHHPESVQPKNNSVNDINCPLCAICNMEESVESFFLF